MKLSTLILPSLLTITMLSCQDSQQDETTKEAPEGGAQQVDPPVLNSGNETERDRALEAVQQDTMNKEIHVGKDPKADNPSRKKDSTQ